MPAHHEAVLLELSARVDALRLERGMSIAQLARLSDLAEQTVMNVLKCKGATLPSLFAIADALHVDLAISLQERPPEKVIA